jgi:hypothetical protein
MDGDWLSYREAAERLNTTAEAIRYRALRGKWPRRRGNDGKARIQLPEHPNPVRTPSAQAVRTPSEPSANGVLIKALEAHVETLKTQLAAAESRLAASAADLSRSAADLEAERARTSAAISAFAALADRLDALAAQRRPWWRRLTG